MMNDSQQKLCVEAPQRGQRLDAFLASECTDISRSVWKGLIQDGGVQVNGRKSKPNYKLKVGDSIEWKLPEVREAGEPKPEDIPLDLLYEDDALTVLNKSPGLVIHPAAGNETGTLVNALLFHDPCFAQVERAGIVHRLDKDTSGVMVVARTEAVLSELRRQFKARETRKEYLALVWGHPPAKGRIENEIARHPVKRKKMAVVAEGGRVAISNYEVLESFAEVSLVRVRIETGRTHQIRVHMAHLGFPVVGDSVYGRSRKNRLPQLPQRQMLHAALLEFAHPQSGKRLSFEAPLFDDMAHLLRDLREGS